MRRFVGNTVAAEGIRHTVDGAKVQYAIVAENAVIGKNCVIGKRPEDMENRDDWGVAVVGPDCKLSEGTVVAPKEMIDKEAQA